MINKYSTFTLENIDNILKNEIGLKFLEVLFHSGVFKRDTKGLAAFDNFINRL